MARIRNLHDDPDTPRKYRPSDKRRATSDLVRQRIKDAAWTVFAREGLDGAAVAHIVAGGGFSTGSFYNHFGAKEAVFDEILADLILEIRSLTATARAQADTLEDMLRSSYQKLLDFILGLDGGVDFISRNQHHIRAKLYGFKSTGGLLDDIRKDILRGAPGISLDDRRLALAAGLIVSNGIEALLLLEKGGDGETGALAWTMTRLIVGGIDGLGEN